MSNPTKQRKESFGKGGVPTPAGFEAHPERRSNGRWNKDDSISYQYNKLGRMSDEELDKFVPTTQFQKIALARIMKARGDDGLMDTKEITDRTEGKATQAVDITTDGSPISAPIVRIIDERQRDTDTK